MKLPLLILIAICAGVASTPGSAQAVVDAVPTYPIPADVGPVAPPIPALPAADESPPPAAAIAGLGQPAAICGQWYLQSNYGGSWPAASTWWEYTCTYSYPQCGGGACNQDWYPSIWTDYFYWDGSKPVFEGEFYGDYYYGSNCTYWWDAPTAQWYIFDNPECPFSGPGNAAPTANFNGSCSGLSCSFDGSGSWASDGITSYRWDFGDGSSGNGASPSHTYAAKGTYRVTLTVTDTGGATSTNSQPVAITNVAPTAQFSFSCSGLSCSFDGSASFDPDGTIQTYYWFFGDGYSARETSTTQNTYAQAGSYTVRLAVLDDKGLEVSTEQTVTVVGVSTNVPPTASFTYSCSGLSCRFDGSGSSDSDGTIIAYQWSFGDYSGASTSANTIDHTYLQAGSYTVMLKVIDDGKATATSDAKTVVVAGPNARPTAAFTFSCSGLSCSFDGSGSADTDGTITGYNWTFGDGTSGSSKTPAHAYAQPGSYTVTLTVTDNDGATATTTHVVVATNAAPTAAFTVSCSGLTCSFDGSRSTDGDGTIDSYRWDFGDGTSGAGKLAQHTYAQPRSYSVGLAVTDNDGATGTASKTFNPISLSARGYKLNGLRKVELSWNGPNGTTVDIYRNGSKIATVQASIYTDSPNTKGSGSYVYEVCAVATSICSNQTTVTF